MRYVSTVNSIYMYMYISLLYCAVSRGWRKVGNCPTADARQYGSVRQHDAWIQSMAWLWYLVLVFGFWFLVFFIMCYVYKMYVMIYCAFVLLSSCPVTFLPLVWCMYVCKFMYVYTVNILVFVCCCSNFRSKFRRSRRTRRSGSRRCSTPRNRSKSSESREIRFEPRPEVWKYTWGLRFLIRIVEHIHMWILRTILQVKRWNPLMLWPLLPRR